MEVMKFWAGSLGGARSLHIGGQMQATAILTIPIHNTEKKRQLILFFSTSGSPVSLLWSSGLIPKRLRTQEKMRVNPLNFMNHFILLRVRVDHKWQLFGNQTWSVARDLSRLWGIPDSWILLLGHIIFPKCSEMEVKSILHKETSSCHFLRASTCSWGRNRKPRCNRKAREFAC